MTDVNVHVTVHADSELPASEPPYVPGFGDKVFDVADVAGEVLAFLCGLVYAVWCVLGKLGSSIAEWRAARRHARRLVIVVPIETAAWLYAHAARTQRALGEVVHDAVIAARAPESLLALRELGAGQSRSIVHARTDDVRPLPSVLGDKVREGAGRQTLRLFDRALHDAMRRLEP